MTGDYSKADFALASDSGTGALVKFVSAGRGRKATESARSGWETKL